MSVGHSAIGKQAPPSAHTPNKLKPTPWWAISLFFLGVFKIGGFVYPKK
jgi:hypothetical protein